MAAALLVGSGAGAANAEPRGASDFALTGAFFAVDLWSDFAGGPSYKTIFKTLYKTKTEPNHTR